MPADPADAVDWNTVTFIFGSKTRARILLELRSGEKTPSQLARALRKQRSHVSRALSELASRHMVKCLTPEARKSRFFGITEKGLRSLEELNRLTKGKQ